MAAGGETAWQEFVSARPLGVVATIGSDGVPHAVPVEVVCLNGRVYAWCKARSAKAKNVGREGKAALVAYKGNDGVLVRGPARLLTASDPEYAAVTQAFLVKYERQETYGNDTLIEIEPVRVTVFG